MIGAPPLRLALLLSMLLPLTAAAQARAGGKVVRITASDTTPVRGAKVMLHRIGRQLQGPIDSMMSDTAGRFHFRFKVDTAAVYLVSSGWDGIEYFSSPLHTEPSLPDTAVVLVVSDTSSTAKVETVSRHIVVSKPTPDGLRAALEIIVISNAGPATRIAPDTLHPTWSASLPKNVAGFTAGSGDFSSEALLVRNDSAQVYAPIAPGEKQLLYTYALPPTPGKVTLHMDDSVGTLSILLEERELEVRGGGLIPIDSQVIEGRTFMKWEGPVKAGSVITIVFPGDTTAWVIPALVGGIALALIIVGAVAVRRRPPRVVAAPPLIDQLARLDARYAGKEASTSAEEWQHYQAERARLKAALHAELARGGPAT
jgi:hypothetical protein